MGGRPAPFAPQIETGRPLAFCVPRHELTRSLQKRSALHNPTGCRCLMRLGTRATQSKLELGNVDRAMVSTGPIGNGNETGQLRFSSCL
jgi:hypothetical protein